MTRSDPMIFRSTTILCVRKDHHVAMGSDGQVTHGTTIMKQNAKKLRRMYNDTVLAGFAGATADAFTLFEKFEGKLQEYRGNLTRAAVELAKDWRMDRALRRLEAQRPVHPPGLHELHGRPREVARSGEHTAELPSQSKLV